MALEGSVGKNGGSITVVNATLVQDDEFCLWVETTTASVTTSAAGVRDVVEWFTIKENF